MLQNQQSTQASEQVKPQPGAEQQALGELQRVATDNNANATPQKNAMDIDTVAKSSIILFITLSKVVEGLMNEVANLKGGSTTLPPTQGV